MRMAIGSVMRLIPGKMRKIKWSDSWKVARDKSVIEACRPSCWMPIRRESTRYARKAKGIASRRKYVVTILEIRLKLNLL